MIAGRKNRRARRPSSQRTQGFLLVEALTAMAIGAFLLVALASAMSLVMRASNYVARSGQSLEQSTRLSAALLADLEGIVPLRWAGPAGGFVFAGTPDSISFARQTTDQEGGIESWFITLNNRDGRPFRSQAILPPWAFTPDDLVASDNGVMSGRPVTLRFAYYQQLADGTEALTDAWTRAGAMPVAIRVTLLDTAGRTLTSVRVKLHVDAELGCAAPERALCSLVPQQEPADGKPPLAPSPIDPDDALGWGRYLR